MLFLRDNGKLDEFVEAKMTGKDAAAKWLLLDSAKDELDAIEKKIRKKEQEELELERRNMKIQ